MECKNVKNYRFSIEKGDFGWNVETREHNEAWPSRKYFVLDTFCHEAFAHWIYESAVHLTEYIRMKSVDPDLKLLLRSPKKYKSLVLKEFGAEFDYELTLSDCANNTCYFPSPTSLHAHTHPRVEAWNGWIEFIDGLASGTKKDTPWLFLPRQKNENYAPNDRCICYNDIEEAVLRQGGQVLHTDAIVSFKDQVKCIASAKRIIVDYGSSFFVNGMISRDADLIVLGNMSQHVTFPAMKALFDKISSRNASISIIGEHDRSFHASQIPKLV